jgi:hypothetical protein
MSPCHISAETPPGFDSSWQPCSTHHPWGFLLEYLHQFVYFCLRNKGHVESGGSIYQSWVSVVDVHHSFLSSLYCPMPMKCAKCMHLSDLQLQSAELKAPTPIQAQSWPIAMQIGT